MTTRQTFDLAIGGLLLLAVIVVAHSWLGEHDARIKAEASVTASQASFDRAAGQIKELEAADRARDQAAAAAVEKISVDAAKQITPQQIAAWIPKQISVPQPITVQVPAPTASNPTPPAIADVPQVDLAPLRDLVVSGQKCAVELPKAQGDLSSCDARAKKIEEQLAAMTKERDDYKQEAEGGTVWQRIKGGTKKVAIGAGIAAAVICGSGHCK